MIFVIVLSVLSLKRMNWAIMLISAIGTFILMPRKWAVLLRLGIVLFMVSLFVSPNNVVYDAVQARYNRSFVGNTGTSNQKKELFDPSAMERFKEYKGAMHTMSIKGLNSYVVGLGHGGEFVSHPDYPFRLSAAGSKRGHFHHIHSMYVLVFFRYGIVGLSFIGLLAMPVFFYLLKITFYFRKFTSSLNFVKYMLIGFMFIYMH